MADQAAIRQVLSRHEAFWKRQEVNRPLVHTRKDRRRLDNLDVVPEMLDVEELCSHLGPRSPARTLIHQDLFHVESAWSAVPWLEAIVGCPVRAGAGDLLVPQPALGPDFEGLERVAASPDNTWQRKLLELTGALVERNDGSYLVTHAQMRGPLDVLTALLGAERTEQALHDVPDRAQGAMAKAAEAFVDVAWEQYDVIPSFHGGSAPWQLGIWAPGTSVRFQCESPVHVSPDLYRAVVLPHDRAIMKAFDYAVVSLRSASTLRLAPVFADEPDLSAIAVTLDRQASAPGFAETLQSLKAILESKCLVVHGDVGREELDMLLKLPPRGLCLNVRVAG